MQGHLIVAAFIDGSRKKGQSLDVDPKRPTCHLKTETGGTVEVALKDVKALFFVRQLEGDAGRVDARGFLSGPEEHPRGRKIAVLFRDGELVCGYSLGYSPQRDAFFLFPADAQSNNQRVFVVVDGTTEVRQGTAAETMVQKRLESEAA